MYDSAKYLIHADIRASGVVERSDVVGAVFGQTEGLLGNELDLRDLQDSQKLGRIDVEIESEGGTSFGEITIASGLDKVETSILAAALESIERVGPCRADVEIVEIEDARSAKRREVIERASELLAEFDDEVMTSRDLVEEVQERVRVDDITEYQGLPAGPRVADSDAIIVVEGRSDVLTLLRYGIKNAVAVEGTDVPDDVADLTRKRTVTAFLDGDRGGDLILRELTQVGEVDYVAIAPQDRSVEDLSKSDVLTALREKIPYEAIVDEEGGVRAATDGSTHPAPVDPTDSSTDGPMAPGVSPSEDDSTESEPRAPEADAEPGRAMNAEEGQQTDVTTRASVEDDLGERESSRSDRPAGDDATGSDADLGEATVGNAEESGGDRSGGDATATGEGDGQAGTLAEHVDAVEDAGRVRLLDGEFDVMLDGPASEAFELVEECERVPTTVVLDGELPQRILDVAAQRGVDRIVCRSEGEFVKQPASVRIRAFEEF